ncbi:MAG TPA: hypothetical protein VGB54_12620 [Allosphingosinicella sp.]|jgi:hypothetical protein
MNNSAGSKRGWRRPARQLLWFLTRVLKAVLLILGALWALRWLVGTLIWPTVSDILKEAPSPDGKAHAYLVRTNFGAGSSFQYSVRLSPSGVGPREARVLVRGASMEGLDFAWTSPRDLRVRVPCGNYSDMTNFLGDASTDLWIKVSFDFERLNCHGRPASNAAPR